MPLQTLTSFFLWCTILNGGLLLLWSTFLMLAPDLVYRMQRTWFPIPRETFTVIAYAFLGFAKIIFLFFNLVPYLVMLIIQ